MSNQGNIVVRDGFKERFIFASVRWSGPAMPLLAQEAIKLSVGYVGDVYESILQFISHDDSIDRPINVIGNEDVPTVIIDVDAKTVIWHYLTQFPVPKMTAEWPWADYLELKLLGESLYRENYE